MKIELLVVPDCPHESTARGLLEASLLAAGLAGTPFDTVVVGAQAGRKELGFIGSPSFFVDGRDLLPVAAAVPAVACRVYRHEDGALAGAPDQATLVQAVRRAADLPDADT